jgi:hypothetical protein
MSEQPSISEAEWKIMETLGGAVAELPSLSRDATIELLRAQLRGKFASFCPGRYADSRFSPGSFPRSLFRITSPQTIQIIISGYVDLILEAVGARS